MQLIEYLTIGFILACLVLYFLYLNFDKLLEIYKKLKKVKEE